MRYVTWLTVIAGLLLPGSRHLEAQREHTFALNVWAQSAATVGITWELEPGFAIRPAVGVSWDRVNRTMFDPNLGVFSYEYTEVQVGLDLDMLFTVAAVPHFATYLGFGGSVGETWQDGNGSVSWTARTLAGLRVTVIERLALFGEIQVYYSHDGGGQSANLLRLGTRPLGVMIYLN